MKILLKSFENINELFHLKGNITLTVCIIDTVIKKAYIANLGDSVTQIFRRNTKNNNFTSIFCTFDHKIIVVDEFGNFNFSEKFITTIDLCEGDVIICSSKITGRNEIINNLNILYRSNSLYSSPTLAQDLMEMHIIDIYRDRVYKMIKENRDNNTLVTYTL